MASTQDAGAPIKDVANSTKDPLASDDYLRGPGDSVNHAAKTVSDQVFTRPERSSARERVQQAAQNAGTAASDAYQRAPDLGVGARANDLYQRAPDLGVGAAVGSVLGAAGLGSSVGEQETKSASGGGSYSNLSKKEETSAQESDNQEKDKDPKRFGPSDKSRVGKSQKEIGTEYGIPTAAGAGTTVSPDNTNKEAQSKAESNGNSRQAAVPQDFEDRPCPTQHAGSSTPSYRKARDVNNEKAAAAASSSKRSSINGKSSFDAPRSPARSEASSGGKRRSFGEKLKDQIKGEATIWKGTIKRDDDIVAHGLDIKHGEY